MDIRVPFLLCFFVLQAPTECRDVELCLHLFFLHSFIHSFIHPVFSNPETTDESLENDDTSLLYRQDMTLGAQNKVKHLFPIGPQEEGRVCLISPPASLTHTDWLFTVSVEPSGHTGLYAERKKNPIRAERDIMQDDEQVLQPYCTHHALEM